MQRVSGETFDDYLDKHIFAPLDMKHSSFRQPLPADLVPLMSKGYELASEEPHVFEIVGPAPAGSMSSPAEDMAHFMIAHLQNGEYNGNRILRAETAEMMHNSPLTVLPPLNRMELGFFETNINGREVIAHLGDTQYFHTSLHLFLKEGVGFYVSFNSPGKEGAAGGLRGALFEDFADRYFPADEKETRVDAKTAASHAALLKGKWVNSRGSQSNFPCGARLGGSDQGRRQCQGRTGDALQRIERQAAAMGRNGSVRLAGDRRQPRAPRRQSGRRQGGALQHRWDFALHGVRPRALVPGQRVAAAAALRESGGAGADGDHAGRSPPSCAAATAPSLPWTSNR